VCKSTCSGTSAIENRCSGSGTCNTSTTTRSCAPYVCDAATGGCKKTCAADGDCAAGFACVSGSCRTPSSVNNCDGSSVIRADGTRIDCAPFNCSNGACRSTCTSGTQCAKGALCDTKSRLCYLPGGDTGSSGCGCAIPGSTTSSERSALGAFVAAAFAVAFARRRRR
jgi:MYXO-CTERM domain-containing protein